MISSQWSRPRHGTQIPNARDYAAKRYTRSESHRLLDKFGDPMGAVTLKRG